MKYFKKHGLGVLFIFVVLIGSLIIANFSFQKQSPGIPNVNAQSQKESNFPGDTIYIPRGSSPATPSIGHPSDTFYIPLNSDLPGNSNNDYYMPGVTTIPTASTCGWDCGPTFTACSSASDRMGQGRTLMTCSSGLFGNCLGQTSTSTTCSSGIFCGGISTPTSTTCSSGIFCGGPSATYTTCGIFCDGGPTPTSSTCSGGIFCGSSSPTSMTCSGSVFCGGNISTFHTCVGSCSTELPLSLPEGVIPGWGGSGIKLPGSVVPFPVFNAPVYGASPSY